LPAPYNVFSDIIGIWPDGKGHLRTTWECESSLGFSVALYKYTANGFELQKEGWTSNKVCYFFLQSEGTYYVLVRSKFGERTSGWMYSNAVAW